MICHNPRCLFFRKQISHKFTSLRSQKGVALKRADGQNTSIMSQGACSLFGQSHNLSSIMMIALYNCAHVSQS